MLLAALGLLRFAAATLPADNGGATTFSVGDLFAGGSVLCTRFTNISAGNNYTLQIGPESTGAAMLVFALQPSDLFTQNMANANSSLDAFLNSDAVGASAVGATSYLFLAYGDTDAQAAAATGAFRERLAARADAVNASIDTLSRMHFAAQQSWWQIG